MSPREATIERIKRRTQEIEDDLREAKWVTDTARLALARAYEDQARRQRAVLELWQWADQDFPSERCGYLQHSCYPQLEICPV